MIRPAALVISVPLLFAGPAVAQDNASEIPITGEAFRTMSVEQAAQRLLAPSGDIFVWMWLSFPEQAVVGGLDSVTFFTQPVAYEPGLCVANAVTIHLEPETPDGAYPTPSTVMKVTGIFGEEVLRVVSEVGIFSDEAALERTSVECASLSAESFWSRGIRGNAPVLSEAVNLLQMAIREAQEIKEAQDRRMPSLRCSDEVCVEALNVLARLDTRLVATLGSGCIPEQQATYSCFSLVVEEAGSRDMPLRWVVELIAEYRSLGPAVLREVNVRPFVITVF